MTTALLALCALGIQDSPTRFVGESVLERIAERSQIQRWTQLPIGERMGRVGMMLVGTPYVAFTLETDEPVEYCTVNLAGLDCVTFFESCLNVARMIPVNGVNQSDLLNAVRRTRYRGGVQGDYSTRLHYTLDWIDDNVRKGIVRDLTSSLPGAQRLTQKVGFMSSHPKGYRQLKANPSLVPAIAKMESDINARPHWFIPTAKISAIEPLLKTGDIIGLCATQPGIDIAHTGIAYRDDAGVLRFFDATNAKGRNNVMLGKRLSQALNPKSHTGIIVARPLP